ncbi:hypothetical protein IL38_22335 [Actinopolyspora erythraea]|nr:hypothetical protein IL38_22335 [Actinopolyspora erythraea]
MRSPALAAGESLAYVTKHRHQTDNGSRWELGAIGHGPAERTRDSTSDRGSWARRIARATDG